MCLIRIRKKEKKCGHKFWQTVLGLKMLTYQKEIYLENKSLSRESRSERNNFFFFSPGKSFNQGWSEWLKNETLILDCVMVHYFLNLFYKIACVLLGCLSHADQAMSPPCCGRKAGLPPWVRCELVVKAAWDIAPGLCSSRGHGAVTIMVGHIYNLRRNWGVNQSVVKADDVFLKQLRKRSVGANRWCCSYNSAT